ncbi:hypothetical protein SEA_MILDRED21_188 [Streptomyces phage Mildred21]|uniref:Uncharacterized protein n=1 Tax=Streptomyces phage Mildred21 TaxID=2023959 RepID=A0A222YVQ9_9CAUD|nr:hypothetical protein FDI35_gp125 [Streptomyces phage Mildred21]ASR75553.1 hypothetical protein SEA_MILDRED21_188 [Streptomyces phage Mildred21]
MKDFICKSCGMFTNEVDQNKATKLHRERRPDHAPNLITSGQWVRMIEKMKS